MTTFPTLTPSSRTFTPGEYPHSAFTGMSGVQNRVRNSNVMLSSQLRLTFAAISESEMLSILTHYQGQQGTFQSFPLPTAIWSGVSSINDYQLSGYGWRYIEPPSVSDAMCANAYDVELTLETVPPEGTAIAGLDFLVLARLVAGTAAAQFSFNVDVSLAAGSATADATMLGFDGSVAVALAAGTATAGSGGDPNFADVSLLLHMDGSNGSTTFTDSSSNNHTMSINDGTVTITTGQSVFGGASADFTVGGDLRTPTSSAFTFDGDFTVELWARRTATTGTVDTLVGSTSTETTLMIRPGSSFPGFFFRGTAFATGFAMTLNTWHHLAMVRNGSTVTAYKDGVSIGSITDANTATCNRLAFGDSGTVNGRYFKGQIDEVRVTKGVARYTANFTPPTAPFPDS
jgi:hypothetical protein